MTKEKDQGKMESVLGNNLPMSDENRKNLNQLAERVFGVVDASVLDKEKIALLIGMDMSTFVSEFVVSANATRPSEVKYATNAYFASLKIDTSQTAREVESYVSVLPTEKMIDGYLEAKAAFFKLLRIKYESMETYLRELLLSAEQKDSCPKVGRFNVEA